MNILLSLILVAQVLSALGVIVLVLLQHGKGADMGAAFGSGASGSLFGATGSANFLSRTTAVLAALFFVATLALALVGNRSAETPTSVMDKVPAAPAQAGGGDAGAPKLPSDVPPAGSGGAAAAAGAAAPSGASGAAAPDAGQASPKNGAASDVPK